jgi:Xaa-Pro aminopeptidase
MDFEGRLRRLRQRLERERWDAIAVTHLTNIRYLTGFTGSAATVLVTTDRVVITTDGRYATQMAEQVGHPHELVVGTVAEQRAAIAKAATGRVAVEAAHTSWARQRELANEWLHAELVPTTEFVEELRAIKDDGEVAAIESAAAVADQALEKVKLLLADGPGITEREFALELDFQIRRLGATGNSFETIVASGPNGAKPHARPSDRRIEAGELVVLDFGALVEGYCSDMTRTVCVGEPATSELTRMVEVVAEAQRAGVAAVRADVEAKAVDAACREVIGKAGWGDAFVHSTGHGVGLDIHEHPLLGETSTATLAAGYVVTVEPGVYIPGLGGVRIEDTVVVTQDGCRPLTNSTKELVVR